jgi:hypothetical protein
VSFGHRCGVFAPLNLAESTKDVADGIDLARQDVRGEHALARLTQATPRQANPEALVAGYAVGEALQCPLDPRIGELEELSPTARAPAAIENRVRGTRQGGDVSVTFNIEYVSHHVRLWAASGPTGPESPLLSPLSSSAKLRPARCSVQDGMRFSTSVTHDRPAKIDGADFMVVSRSHGRYRRVPGAQSYQ